MLKGIEIDNGSITGTVRLLHSTHQVSFYSYDISKDFVTPQPFVGEGRFLVFILSDSFRLKDFWWGGGVVGQETKL